MIRLNAWRRPRQLPEPPADTAGQNLRGAPGLPWAVSHWDVVLRSVSADTMRELARQSHPVLLPAERETRISGYSLDGKALRIEVRDTARYLPYFEVELNLLITATLRERIGDAELFVPPGMDAFLSLAKSYGTVCMGQLLQQMGLPPVAL